MELRPEYYLASRSVNNINSNKRGKVYVISIDIKKPTCYTCGKVVVFSATFVK